MKSRFWVSRDQWVASDDPQDTTGDPRHPLLRNLPADINQKIPSHYQNFLDSMRAPAVVPAVAAHRAASFGQLAIVAMDTGEAVHWEPVAEAVRGKSRTGGPPASRIAA